MKISERLSDDMLVMEPKERLTVETEPDFASYFIRLLEAGHRHFAISLAGVPYIDSVGLGAIVRAYTSARRRGGDLRLINVQGKNPYLLEINKLLTGLNGETARPPVTHQSTFDLGLSSLATAREGRRSKRYYPLTVFPSPRSVLPQASVVYSRDFRVLPLPLEQSPPFRCLPENT